jgi:hypothetical protein
MLSILIIKGSLFLWVTLRTLWGDILELPPGLPAKCLDSDGFLSTLLDNRQQKNPLFLRGSEENWILMDCVGLCDGGGGGS